MKEWVQKHIYSNQTYQHYFPFVLIFGGMFLCIQYKWIGFLITFLLAAFYIVGILFEMEAFSMIETVMDYKKEQKKGKKKK